MQPAGALIVIRIKRDTVVNAHRAEPWHFYAQANANAVLHVAQVEITSFTPYAAGIEEGVKAELLKYFVLHFDVAHQAQLAADGVLRPPRQEKVARLFGADVACIVAADGACAAYEEAIGDRDKIG